MEQKDKHFIPHVLAVPVGATVDFPNLDPIFHNVFSNYNGQIFDLSLYRPKTSRTSIFKRPGIVRVFCNIHPTMSAIIAGARYALVRRLRRLQAILKSAMCPPGNYTLHIFHERATDETLNALVQPVAVDSRPRASCRPSAFPRPATFPRPTKTNGTRTIRRPPANNRSTAH